MKKFTPGIITSSSESKIELQTKIIWGDENGGSDCFPDMTSISYRKGMKEPRPFDIFGKAVGNAKKRIWIIDAYFLIPDDGPDWSARIMNILEWFPPRLEASDIRILTSEQREIDDEMLGLFQIKANDINYYHARRPIQCTIEVCTRLGRKFDFIHDRFAIIDDELWHFGATVGGFHSSVNAASRGWNAETVGAIKFFEMAWDKCKEIK